LQKLEEEFLASGGEWKRTILKDWFTIKTSVSFDKGNIELSNNSNGNDYEFIGRTSDLSLIMATHFLLFKLVKILLNLENINGMVAKIYSY